MDTSTLFKLLRSRDLISFHLYPRHTPAVCSNLHYSPNQSSFLTLTFFACLTHPNEARKKHSVPGQERAASPPARSSSEECIQPGHQYQSHSTSSVILVLGRPFARAPPWTPIQHAIPSSTMTRYWTRSRLLPFRNSGMHCKRVVIASSWKR